MARLARIVLPEYPHHVVQKGNGGQGVFLDRPDYEKYLQLLQTYSRKSNCGIQAYCLMPNHVHLLVVPKKETSLAEMMHTTTFVYTQYFNRKYNRKGCLWGNRFYSSIVDTDSYHWTAALYIEQNPVRAGIIPSPPMYKFSSARAHAEEKDDPLLTDSLFDEFEKEQYIKALMEPIGEEELESARKNTRLCRPLGSAKFVKMLEKLFGISFTPGPRGPRKGTIKRR